MHRQVGPAVQQGRFQLFHEQALAADLAERAVENLVAQRGHAQQFDLPAQAGFEQGLDMRGLPHRQSAFAGGDHHLDGFFGILERCSHW
jgi:hypothetical protein